MKLSNNENITASYNSTTSLTYVYDTYYPKVVINTIVDQDTITITYVQRARYAFSNTHNGIENRNTNLDKVFKEVYGVVDGKLTLLKTINGRIIPPTFSEEYEFEED